MITDTLVSSRPQAAATPLQRGMVRVLGALLLLALCYLHFSRNFAPGQLSPEGMDMVQAARRVARGHGLSTNVVRPLVLRDVRPRPDGSLPNVAHAPLYPLLAGTAMRVTGNIDLGGGDNITALLSLFWFLASLGACYLLARRLFGPDGALLSCLLYALAANALPLALEPRPATLATTLFTLLLAQLVALDVTGTNRRASVVKAAGAGALWGLLFLTLYSSLLLLAPLLVYLFLATKRDYRVPGVFLVAALLIASPALLRSLRATGNPLYNARLTELVMQTGTYPGYTLYRSVGMTRTLPEYLAGGGVAEIQAKAANNLLGYYAQLPRSFGVLLLPLFLVAALTRFTSPPVNRLRYLVYALFLLHILGLSLYLPFEEGLPVLLMYLPFVAVIGTTFFLNLIRARSLPPFYARATITAWAVLACLPGAGQLFFGGVKPQTSTYKMSDGLIERAFQDRAPGTTVLVADVPWEVAHRVDVPAIWLPVDSVEFEITEDRLGKRITGIVMTPELERAYTGDSAVAPWRTSYARVTSLVNMLALLRSDESAQKYLLKRVPTARLYAPEVAGILTQFGATPFAEADGAHFGIYWARQTGAARQN